MATQVKTRPFGITLIMIYGIIAGIANIAVGIFTILDRNDPDLISESFHSPSQLLAAGIVSIVFGTIMVFLATALGHANNVVRIIYAVIASINLALGLWATFALHSEQQVVGIVTSLFAALILYLLFNSRADEYFESK